MPTQFLQSVEFNCSTSEGNIFYCGIFADNWYKYLTVCFSVILVTVGIALSAYAVWYEINESNANKTIINELSSLIHITGTLGLLVTHVIELARYLYGPLNKHICFLQVVIKHSIKTEILLFLDANIIARYVVIFHCKNPLAIEDGLWSTFVCSSIFILSKVFNFAIFFVRHQQPINFYICADMDPTSFMSESQKIFGNLEIASFILHVILKLRIWIFKLKCGPDILKDKNNVLNFDDKTFNDFAINTLLIFFFALYAILNQKVSSFDLATMNQFPSFILVQFFNLLGPGIIFITVCSFYYKRHKMLRRHAIKTIYKLFSNVQLYSM